MYVDTECNTLPFYFQSLACYLSRNTPGVFLDFQKPIMSYINNLNPTYFPIPVIRGSRYPQGLTHLSDVDTVVLARFLGQKQARAEGKVMVVSMLEPCRERS